MSHFAAVDFAFTLLLVFEVIDLVLGLTRSVSRAAGKQFEVFSLILIRESFKTFTELEEPLMWQNILETEAIYKVSAEAVGALLIFVVLGVYYRAQRHKRITADEQEQASFIIAKKLIASALLVVFAGVAVYSFLLTLQGLEGRFFERFFTVLVFSDILIVLISLRYSASYHVAFRNVGFALATVFIRIGLIAPVYIDAIIGVGAAVFSLGITYAYNRFAPEIEEQEEQAKKEDETVRERFVNKVAEEESTS
jgi:uncharacterized membrane protein